MDEKAHLILRITKTLNALLQVLDELQVPETRLVERWLDILQRNDNEEQINEAWHQIEGAGAHMGFMDYADPRYDALIWRPQQQMLALVKLMRRSDS